MSVPKNRKKLVGFRCLTYTRAQERKRNENEARTVFYPFPLRAYNGFDHTPAGAAGTAGRGPALLAFGLLRLGLNLRLLLLRLRPRFGFGFADGAEEEEAVGVVRGFETTSD